MTPGDFLNEFGAVANAPGGVQRLREMILQLAVQGKLVEQNPDDEPASDLLSRIEVEKGRLINEKKIRRINQSYSIDAPYKLPHNWLWTTLAEIGTVSPHILSDNDKEASFVPMPLIDSKYGIKVKSEKRTWGEIKNGYTQFAEGDVALAKITPCFQNGKSTVMEGLTNGIGAGTTELHVVRSYFTNPYYILIFIKSPRFINDGIPYMTGSAGQKRIPKDYFSNTAFPLPPLEEQKRIVAKVDQLMAICDQLEAQQQKRSNLVKHTRICALEALANAQGGDELQTAWKRVEENLPMLFEHPEDVEDLKKCILQNAVMGKLVPQNPDDEPASELLKKISKEKAELIEKGEIKRQKPLPEIRDDEKPFEIPNGWEWAHIADIVISTDYGLSSKTENLSIGYPVLKMGDIQKGQILLGGQQKVPPETEGLPNLFLKNGDLLFNRTNSVELVGKTAIFEGPEECYTFASYLIRIRPSKSINSTYINYCMNTPYFKMTQIEPQLIKQCGQANVNGTKMRSMILPIPSFEEQKRIVEKTQSLLSICDTLQKQLAKSRKVAEQLAQSIVESITGISTGKMLNDWIEEPEKAGITIAEDQVNQK